MPESILTHFVLHPKESFRMTFKLGKGGLIISSKGENVSLRHKVVSIYKAVIFSQHISKENCFPK